MPMKSHLLFLVFMIIPYIDIIVELINQAFWAFILPKSFENMSLSDFGLGSLASAINLHDFQHAIKHSHLASTIHLLKSLAIVSALTLFLIVTLNKSLRSPLIKLVSILRLGFHSEKVISRFEISILYLMTFIIRALESKWLFNLFVKEDSLMDYMWILVLLLVVVVEVRFKVYLEKIFHSASTTIICAFHLLGTLILPFVIYYFHTYMNGSELEFVDNISNGLVEDDPLQLINPSCHHGLKIHYLQFFRSGMFLVEGKKDHFKDLEKIMFLIAMDSYKSNVFWEYFLKLIIKNIVYIVTIYFADKYFLNSLCSDDIHHICAHLIMEEYINSGFIKIFNIPFSYFEQQTRIAECDTAIYEYLKDFPNSVKSLIFAFQNKMNNHEMFDNTFIYNLWNNSSSLSKRAERIFSDFRNTKK